jgi:predicted HicB family RNase H-like nuclease
MDDLSASFTVRLDRKTNSALKNAARTKGVSASELVRRIIAAAVKVT